MSHPAPRSEHRAHGGDAQEQAKPDDRHASAASVAAPP